MAYFYRMVGDGIKLASLILLPELNDVPTMNKLTSIELDQSVITEPQPEEDSLGHLLPLIFKPFTVPIPLGAKLTIKLSKIIYRNKHINNTFHLNSPDDMVPLYDTKAGLWNWGLPLSYPNGGGIAEDCIPLPGVEKSTHKEIFTTFINAFATSMAESQPKLLTPSATRIWSAAHSTTLMEGTEIRCKPDLVLSDDIKPKWGNIRVCAELTVSSYKPAQWLVRAADTQAYLLLSNQPWRRFTLILSFTSGYNDLRVLLYDHSGGIVSPYCNINHQSDTFAQIIATVIFGSPECAHMPGCRPFKNLLARADTTCDMSIAPSLDEFPEDLQEGPISGALKDKPMSLRDSSHNSREEYSISPSASSASPHLPLPLPPLEATSTPLLNLASRAPVGGDDFSFSATF
ncbi:hypothetical protein EV424DRAFT_1532202 [Suillus variegatus]|nr:hypothetical protein EV424DRAFT_1532202 [Suillus variegatus]